MSCQPPLHFCPLHTPPAQTPVQSPRGCVRPPPPTGVRSNDQVLFPQGPLVLFLCALPVAYPRYADATRTKFKSSTRLECMMQDFPKTLTPDHKVGFTVSSLPLHPNLRPPVSPLPAYRNLSPPCQTSSLPP